MTDKKETVREERDKKLMALFDRGLTNAQVAEEFGCTVRGAGSHRARLLNNGKVPQPGHRHSGNNSVRRDDGAYMAFVTENEVVGPEDAEIRFVRYRPLPATAISYARVGSAAAMCAAMGERRAA